MLALIPKNLAHIAKALEQRQPSDGGGENWAILASLIETCKLSRVDPQAYLADTLIRIVNGHLNSAIDDLLPWAYAPREELLRDVA